MEIPAFKTEAEEASWWVNNQGLVLKELHDTAQTWPSLLGRGTLKKKFDIQRNN